MSFKNRKSYIYKNPKLEFAYLSYLPPPQKKPKKTPKNPKNPKKSPNQSYHASPPPSGTPPTVSLPAPDKRLPGSPPVKLRLLSCFTHSVQAANCFPATLQVIFDAVYGERTATSPMRCTPASCIVPALTPRGPHAAGSDSSLRLKGAGMEFAVSTPS